VSSEHEHTFRTIFIQVAQASGEGGYSRADFDDEWAHSLEMEGNRHNPVTQLNKPESRHAWDFVHHGAGVAVEIHGQIWRKGGHSSGRGIKRDCLKTLIAAERGFTPISIAAPDQLTFNHIERVYRVVRRAGS
jgi:hypothetical protein